MKQKLGSRFNSGYRPAKLTEQRITVNKTFVPEGNKKIKFTQRATLPLKELSALKLSV